jgi:hypothetical protein
MYSRPHRHGSAMEHISHSSFEFSVTMSVYMVKDIVVRYQELKDEGENDG